jgi:hypothetical protein
MSVPIGRQIGVLVQEQGAFERRLRDLVTRHQMRQSEADYLVESFVAAITTLEWVRDHEAAIKRVHGEIEGGEIAS